MISDLIPLALRAENESTDGRLFKIEVSKAGIEITGILFLPGVYDGDPPITVKRSHVVTWAVIHIRGLDGLLAALDGLIADVARAKANA